ncbi:MAG: hypothetical protein II416_02910, partial [Prevotella sp.]|nr:hypothetical protein [Prevotella sp.]
MFHMLLTSGIKKPFSTLIGAIFDEISKMIIIWHQIIKKLLYPSTIVIIGNGGHISPVLAINQTGKHYQ